MSKLVIAPDPKSIEKALDFIESQLNEKKFKHKDILETMLLSEESLVNLIDNSDGSNIHLKIESNYKLTKIIISSPGKEFQPETNLGIDFNDVEDGHESENLIRNLLFQNYSNRLKYINKNGCNFMEISIGMPEKKFALLTSCLFLSSILLGLFIKYVLPSRFCITLDTYLLQPIEIIFINSLKLTAAPIVFLSILTNVAQSSSFNHSSKANIKIIASYLLTSIIAVAVGIISFRIVDPGVKGELASFVNNFSTENLSNATDMGSIIETITSIVPDNFVAPFLNLNTLQLIFISMISGIALGRAGKYSKPLQTGAQALGSLCNMIAKLLQNILPYAIVVSTVSLVINLKAQSLKSFGMMLVTLAFGFMIMLIFYVLFIVIFGRLNPLKFFKKFYPTMKIIFFLSSSVAAIPKTITCCKNKLGISDKITSFSIPFGAMANMDGNCIYLAIVSLFIAKICGVDLYGSSILSLVISVIVISIGSPIASGSVLIFMSVLLSQLGISTTAICILLGINSIMEMILALSDTIGDIAVSLVVARTENQLNLDVYNS